MKEDSFLIGIEHAPDFRRMMNSIGARYTKSYIKRARAYFSLVAEALANSDESKFPLLRAWLRDVHGTRTTDQIATLLYDDALASLALMDWKNDQGQRLKD